MRRMIIAGNWKMYTDAGEARKLAHGVAGHVGRKTDPVVLLCPPAPLLTSVNEVIKGTPVKLGGQNVHPEPYGAEDCCLHFPDEQTR